MQINSKIRNLNLPSVPGEEDYVARISQLPLSLDEFKSISGMADYIGVTPGIQESYRLLQCSCW